ncbi:MAG: hypothetical protein QM779_10505 [Propionicimonas sp.]|uniref:hypothetical protein n=1 Tax=Propionicimonas sp. TaxID=1955623 RepID=UPI003D0BCC8D
MIIWSRWGFLSFLGFGVGVGLAFATASLFGLDTSGLLIGALIFLWAAAINLLLAYLVYPRLDKPRPVTVVRRLPQPYTWPDGRVQTEEVVPALDPQGRPVWTTPRSTLFFIPANILWIPLLAVSLVLAVASFFSR